jgi:hypothetical protein
MVSEKICLEILQMMRGRRSTCTRRSDLDKPGQEKVQESHVEDAIAEGDLFRPLLHRYDLSDIDASVRWLQLGGFLGRTEWGLRGPWVHTLSDKACSVADAGSFAEEDRELFYRINPYAVFIAHQFNEPDQELVGFLQSSVLEPNGFVIFDGKAEGLDEFRHSIIAKIKKARFFLCLLTRRAVLDSGSYVSSVWLYQEIGAAMAYGKKPLLFVEEGIDPQYVGELQRVYEYTNFTRSNHPRVFPSILGKLQVDLESALIPLPHLFQQSGQQSAER